MAVGRQLPLFKITAGSHIAGNYGVLRFQLRDESGARGGDGRSGRSGPPSSGCSGTSREQTETTVANTATNGQPNQTWGGSQRAEPRAPEGPRSNSGTARPETVDRRDGLFALRRRARRGSACILVLRRAGYTSRGYRWRGEKP